MKNAALKMLINGRSDWTWSGASVRGTSHCKTGDPKQDSAAVAEYSSAEGAVIVVVVCDGAGSAAHSDIGARVACHCAHSLVKEHLAGIRSIAAIDRVLAGKWLSTIRQKIADKAHTLGTPTRELATTISIVIAGRESTVLIMVGDSPCVVHDCGAWVAPIWPMGGEHANQTYFVTQNPITYCELNVDRRMDKVAVFTDGIEKLVMKNNGRQVFQPFFDALFRSFPCGGKGGRDRPYSTSICDFLTSERVNNLTDDDKTLIIAARSGAALGD